MPTRLGEIVDLILAGSLAARRNFVQHGPPKARPGTFHQRDAEPRPPAKAVAKSRYEFESCCTTPNYNHAMKVLISAHSQELTIGSRRSLGSIIPV